MPMPREEDEDLFHTEADVEFDDDSPKKKKKKAAKKKTAKKATKKKTAKKKAAAEEKPSKKAKKKAAKKKAAKRVTASSDDEDMPRVKPKRSKTKPKKKASGKGFGAGLFDESAEKEDQAPGDAEVTAAQAEPDAALEAETAVEMSARRADARHDSPNGSPNDDETAASADEQTLDEDTDEYGRPAPVANYVVHLYELGRLKRTLERPFTPEDAEAFATKYTQVSKRYGRRAVAGKKDTQPAKEIAEA